eukprot:GEMP01050925.1.p1 GENE.GEMP01050925.1~~GEMP01050925.1.p1  ORF type:complete len:259 (+),score=57.72 GEMP01050925.1:78-854(+)
MFWWLIDAVISVSWSSAAAMGAISLIIMSIFVAHHPSALPPSSARTALIIAHPDDEVMFFYPTLLYMRTNSVYLLCLSTGNADKLGSVRVEELQRSCSSIPSIALCDVRDSFPDGMDQKWDIPSCSREINAFLTKHAITRVMTFDHEGISGHPNHCDVSRAVQALLVGLRLQDKITVFFLRTVPMWRKYIGVADAVVHVCGAVEECTVTNGNPMRTLLALTKHWSQMVWFRWFWCFVSRYSYVNSFRVMRSAIVDNEG